MKGRFLKEALGIFFKVISCNLHCFRLGWEERTGTPEHLVFSKVKSADPSLALPLQLSGSSRPPHSFCLLITLHWTQAPHDPLPAARVLVGLKYTAELLSPLHPPLRSADSLIANFIYLFY